MIIFDTDIFLSLGVSNVTSFCGEALILDMQVLRNCYTGSRCLCGKETFLAALGPCRSWEGLPAAQGTGGEPGGLAKCPARLQRAPFHSFLVCFLCVCGFFSL